MTIARKKSLVTTIYIYIGFIFGAVNTFLFSKYFLPEENGLTRIFIDLTLLFSSFANLGAATLLVKFYPYYRSRMPFGKIDLLSLCFYIVTIGFLLLMGITMIFQPLIIQKFSGKSPMLVDYFYYVYPMVYFFICLQILEVHAWNMQKTILPNFFKEVVFRLLNLVIILLFMFGWITFHTFMICYSLLYATLFLGLLGYFIYVREIPFTFRLSRLTGRLWRKMLPFSLFMLAGSGITMLSKTVDSLIITSIQGLDYLAAFALANYICAVVEVPLRSIVSIATPIVAQAWKDRNIAKISDVYNKTSLNLLLFSSFLLALIWLNFNEVFTVLQLPAIYFEGKPLVLLLGISKIIELGTGLNSQIIVTSRKWKFEFYSNMILLAMTLPLNYWLINAYGMVGAGYATLVSIGIFNLIRFVYLWRKYGLQPFSLKTAYAFAVPLLLFLLVDMLVHHHNPFFSIFLRTAAFCILYLLAVLQLNISEDATQVWHNFLARVRRSK